MTPKLTTEELITFLSTEKVNLLDQISHTDVLNLQKGEALIAKNIVGYAVLHHGNFITFEFYTRIDYKQKIRNAVLDFLVPTEDKLLYVTKCIENQEFAYTLAANLN